MTLRFLNKDMCTGIQNQKQTQKNSSVIDVETCSLFSQHRVPPTVGHEPLATFILTIFFLKNSDSFGQNCMWNW